MSPPPVNRVILKTGGKSTHFGASRPKANSSQALLSVNGQFEARGALSPPAAKQWQPGDTHPSPAECRSPAATAHTPPVLTLSQGSRPSGGPGQAGKPRQTGGPEQAGGSDVGAAASAQ